MANRICLIAMSLFVSVPAASDAVWPEFLDVDLSYRNSALLDENQRWDFRVGAAVDYEPTYQGSDRNETEFGPLLIAAYRAEWGNIFFSGEGLGYSRMFSDRFGLSVVFEAEDTREVDDDNRLAGLGNQDEELEVEINGRYFLGPFSLDMAVATATGEKGTVWFLGGSYTWRTANERAFLTVGADLSGSDQKNQQTDFGVTESQSALTGYPVYTPGGGLKSAGLKLALEYQLSDRWYVLAGFDYERLLGDVVDSPIVFDENNIEASLGVFYRF